MRTLLVGILCLFNLSSWAHEVQRPLVPKHSFALNDNQSGISENEVMRIYQFLEREYAHQIPELKKPLSSGFVWSQSFIGAGTTLFDGEFKIMLWGGLVRAKYMNRGALAAVLCHEIGHRLGGEPFQQFQGEKHWSSAEGQSDHFAATDCLPKLYKIFKKEAPAFLIQEKEKASDRICSKLSAELKSQCQWVATAGIDLIQFFQVYYDVHLPLVNPMEKPQEIVDETLHTKYPSSQCRMEIFKVGATCFRGLQCARIPCWYRVQSSTP